MDCPKCNSAMQELKIETLHGQVVIDKCESCSGLWFDNGEAEQLKGDWMAEFAHSCDPEVDKSYNTVRDTQCPRCGKTMKSSMTPSKSILNTKHATSTACLWMQKFTDYKYETLLDIFRDAVASLKRASKDVRVAACRAARLGALIEMPSWVGPDGIFCSR